MLLCFRVGLLWAHPTHRNSGRDVQVLTTISFHTDFILATLYSDTWIDALTSFTPVFVQNVAEFTLLVTILMLTLMYCNQMFNRKYIFFFLCQLLCD